MQLFSLEWRALMASPATGAIAALAILFQCIALLTSAGEIRAHRLAAEESEQQQRTHQEAVRGEIAMVEEQRRAAGIPLSRLRPGIPAPGAVEGRIASFRASLPPLSTGLLSVGASDSLPQRYSYRTGERFSPFTRTSGTRILGGLFAERQTENPASLLNGTFDLGFVHVYILPILILALSYNLVSADRESGVLALVLAQPVSLRQLLVARITARAVFLVGLTVILPAVMALAIARISMDALPLLGAWMIAAAAYTSFWLFLGALVSARSRSSAASSVLAIASWLVLVVVVPALGNLSRSALIPAKSAVSFVDAERAASLDVNPRIDKALAALNRLTRGRIASHPARQDRDDPSFTDPVEVSEAVELVDHLVAVRPRWPRAMATVQLSRAIAEARRILIEEQLSQTTARVSAEERRLDLLTAGLQYSSPALLFQSIADTTAGTDHPRWKHFLSQIDDYVRQRGEFFTEKILEGRNVQSVELDHLTVFKFQEDVVGAKLTRLVVPIACLVGLSAFVGTLALGVSRLR